MKKILWVKIACLFYTNLVYSAVEYYQQCPPVSECLSESQLEQEYTEHKNSPAALFDLSKKNYSHRLECSMSTFLNEDLPERCQAPMELHFLSRDRTNIKNRFFIDDLLFSSRFFTDDTSSFDTSPSSKIDPICFHAGSLRGIDAIDGRYECSHYYQVNARTTCAEGHPKCRFSPTSGPCLSQTYAEKLSNTFDRVAECAGLNSTDKNNLFAILNHESAFMPNARSSSHARCMGQLTTPVVREISARVAAGLVGASEDSRGIEEVFEKCPELNDYTIPADIENNLLPYAREHRGSKTYNNALKEIDLDEETKAPREHRRMHYPMTCKLTSNPITCLMYATLNYRLNKNSFDNILPQNSHLISNTDRQKFKNLVLKLSYNFGGTLTSLHLEQFLLEIDCTSASCSTPVFKEKLDQGEQINAQDFSKEFINYVFKKKDTWLRKYKTQGAKEVRCTEVREYVLKTLDDINFLQDREHIQSDWNNQVGNSPEAFDSFFNEVQNKCSSRLQEIFMSREDLKDIFEQTNLCNFDS